MASQSDDLTKLEILYTGIFLCRLITNVKLCYALSRLRITLESPLLSVKYVPKSKMTMFHGYSSQRGSSQTNAKPFQVASSPESP